MRTGSLTCQLCNRFAETDIISTGGRDLARVCFRTAGFSHFFSAATWHGSVSRTSQLPSGGAGRQREDRLYGGIGLDYQRRGYCVEIRSRQAMEDKREKKIAYLKTIDMLFALKDLSVLPSRFGTLQLNLSHELGTESPGRARGPLSACRKHSSKPSSK